MESALVELVLESPDRVLLYGTIAEVLDIPVGDVELLLLRAMDNGAVSGRVDAQRGRFVVDGTRAPVVTPERVRAAAAGLDVLESQLTAQLNIRKRSRNDMEDRAIP